MSEIGPDHAEWASVYRWSRLLERPPRGLELTTTYAAYTAILCWCMQRIRRDDGVVALLHKELRGEQFSQFFDQPRLRIVSEAPMNDFADFVGDVGRFSSLDVLIKLRDAVAHGDGGSVTPVNRKGELLGFRFFCARLERRQPVWRGEVTLDQFGMRDIASKLASRFCEALDLGSGERLSMDARRMTEQRVSP